MAGDAKTNARNSGDRVRVRASTPQQGRPTDRDIARSRKAKRPSLGSGGAEKAASAIEKRKSRTAAAGRAAAQAIGRPTDRDIERAKK